MQVCHQVINAGETLAFPSLKFGNGLARGGVRGFHIEGHPALISNAASANGWRQRWTTHCFERISGTLLGAGVDASADIGIGGARSFPLKVSEALL